MAKLPYKSRKLIWMGDSLEQISSFPRSTKSHLGFAIRQVQNGEMPKIAKPLKGYGSGVYELKSNAADNTYRVVYVVRLVRAVYALDAFVKKSKSGNVVPKEIRNRIKARLKAAEEEDGRS